MHFILKATLKGYRLRVQIIDPGSRQVLLDWNEAVLWRLLSSAQLSEEDWCTLQAGGTSPLIDKLLRMACQMELAPLAGCPADRSGVVAWQSQASGTVRLFMAGWPLSGDLADADAAWEAERALSVERSRPSGYRGIYP